MYSCADLPCLSKSVEGRGPVKGCTCRGAGVEDEKSFALVDLNVSTWAG